MRILGSIILLWRMRAKKREWERERTNGSFSIFRIISFIFSHFTGCVNILFQWATKLYFIIVVVTKLFSHFFFCGRRFGRHPLPALIHATHTHISNVLYSYGQWILRARAHTPEHNPYAVHFISFELVQMYAPRSKTSGFSTSFRILLIG